MPSPNAQQTIEEVPLKIVGGNLFGRYPKISIEETFNFIVSDNFLVPYAGYKNVLDLLSNEQGRGLYSSSVGNIMIAVIGFGVYSITPDLTPNLVGELFTNTNDVYIAENNNFQICITDGVYVYVYNYSDSSFKTSNPSGPGGALVNFPTTFSPGYISFQNGQLIIACINTQVWQLSDFNNALVWPQEPQNQGAIQSKPCTIQAAVPLPGGGNNLLVFGTNVAESWQYVGSALFPYQRNPSFNIDYGCLNAASIAALENFVVWLSFNEQAGPALSYTTGGPVQNISTDGIAFKFGELTNPENCTGFLFRQDGHLIYQFTFITDNLSYAYDFNSKLFFTVTDDQMNYHIAREVVFFNNNYYFVSLNAGNIYGFGTQYTDADYGDGNVKQIPKVRICPPLRLANQRYFINKSLGFTVENGEPNQGTTTVIPNFGNGNYLLTQDGDYLLTQDGNYLVTQAGVTTRTSYSEAVDLSISRDGGYSFGSSIRLSMNPTGQRKSRFIFQRLGIANDTTFQLRFSGFGRFVVTDGICEVSQ